MSQIATPFLQFLYDLIRFPYLLFTYLRGTPSKSITQQQASSASSDSTLDPTRPCRYPLDTSNSATIILPDGRKLGYAQYGAPDGQAPIIYVHGFVASRIEAALLDAEASKLGARIIAVDRPGVGLSSPQPGRRLLDHARDIEHLTTHLGLTKYGVLGISGGGPYALACARALPADKLRAVSLVCGLGAPDMGYSGMKPLVNRLGWAWGMRSLPSFAKWYASFWLEARLDLSDEERLRRFREQFEQGKASMHPKDAAVFGDHDFMLFRLASSRQAYAQGTTVFAEDARVMSSPWEFRIEDIRKDLPVYLWYGKLDTNVPLHHGEKIAARIGPNAYLRVKDDDTHVSISQNYKQEYLGELVRAIEVE